MVEIFYLALVLILGCIVWYSWYYGITPTPTSPQVKNKILQILPKDIKGEVAELGSGWGNLAFALARHFPTHQVKAYEISPIPYWVSKGIAKLLVYPNLHIIRQDFFTVSLEHVSLVVCYLYPDAMLRLKAKFEKELAPKTYILSHTFAIPGWTPLFFVKASDLYQTPIYLYQISYDKISTS